MKTDDVTSSRDRNPAVSRVRRRRLIVGATLTAGGAIAGAALSPVLHAIAAASEGTSDQAQPTPGRLRAANVQVPGSWSVVPGLLTPRSAPAVVLLFSGQLLVVGGTDSTGAPVGTSEIFNSLTGVSTLTGSEATPRTSALTVLLDNGKVLRAGGLDAARTTLKSAELYDPTTGIWTPTASLSTGRWSPNVVTLHQGNVLVFGGQSGTGGSATLLTSAEVYNPATETWLSVGAMTAARNNPSQILLSATGQLLVFGGRSLPSNSSSPLGSAEIYHPHTGNWSATGGLTTARVGHTINQVPTNGKILAAGGVGTSGTVLNSAELYDPIAGTWATTSTPMTAARTAHSATVLSATGMVLVAGGLTGSSNSTVTSSTELYDPVHDTWGSAGGLSVARSSFSFALLSGEGRIFAHGGIDVNGAPVGPSELYSPALKSWTSTASLNTPRTNSTVVILSKQTVIRVGGKDASGNVLGSVELYAQTLLVRAAWVSAGVMLSARTNHSQVLLASGLLLVAGGEIGTTPIRQSELYDEVAGSWSATGLLTAARSSFSLTRLPNGTVLAAGGTGGSGSSLTSAESYSPATGAWSAVASMAHPRSGQRAELVGLNGMLLVAGGGTATTELYNWVLNTWSSAGSMSAARSNPTIVAMNTGLILLAGGADNSGNALASADLYNPFTNTWSPTTALNVARSNGRAAVLNDGTVLVAGGFDTSGNPLTSIEVYDPIDATWTITAQFTTPRAQLTTTVLPNGVILAAGGQTPAPTASAELYDPVGRLTLVTISMATARALHGMTLLPNGQVIVTGGVGAGNAPLDSAEAYIEAYYPAQYQIYVPMVVD